MAKGSNASKSYRKRGHSKRRPFTFRVNAPVFVPSWLRRTLRNSNRVVSNGINSLLREINTKRRRSLNTTRKSR